MDDARLYAACARHGTPEQSDAYAALWRHIYPIAYSMLREQPDASDLASDCAQQALINIHRHLGQCRNPETFQSWAARITRNAVLDLLRQPSQRLSLRLPDGADDGPLPPSLSAPPHEAKLDLRAVLEAELLRAAREGLLSRRSYRVVVGRFFAEQDDQALANEESRWSEQTVLRSHIQVTRSKNLDKLRKDTALLARLRELLEE